MGRKTFESIGRPLPGRQNIVITRNKSWTSDGCDTVHSLSEAFAKAEQDSPREVFVIGGGQIYKEALDLCNKLYLSEIDFDGEADTFFPEYQQYSWETSHHERFEETDGKPAWCFSVINKK